MMLEEGGRGGRSVDHSSTLLHLHLTDQLLTRQLVGKEGEKMTTTCQWTSSPFFPSAATDITNSNDEEDPIHHDDEVGKDSA